MNRLFILSFAILTLSCMKKQEADLIIHNAIIYTVDEAFNTAEAMAISGDSILEVGAEHQIMNKYSSAEILDMNNAFIYPGFIDAHSHFWGYAEQLGRVDLLQAGSKDDICDLVEAFAKERNDNWITGRGWDNTTWNDPSFPDRSCLDERFPDKYILLKRIDGHAALVSGNLLELAGITPDTKIEGGKVEVKDGRCTGILIDRAVDLVDSLVAETSEGVMRQLLQQAEKDCLSKGLTSVCDAGLDKKEIDLLMEMHEKGELKLKLYLMLNPSEENFTHFLNAGPYQDGDISIRSFKFYADGALGSRGAALLEEYADDEGNTGLLVTSEKLLKNYADMLSRTGFQMNTHAIGDAANRMVLSIYADALKGVNDRRWRVEHAQVVHPDDWPMFGRYNIIPSVQPTHCTSDMDWAIDRLGEERIDRAYAFKSLMKQNGMLPLGTDFPVENINPLHTFIAAVHRTDLHALPEGGYKSQEALSVEEAIRGMTIWAAIANFEEDLKGSLEAGKRADFVVFNNDLKALNANNLDEFKVLATYVNGQALYQPRN